MICSARHETWSKIHFSRPVWTLDFFFFFLILEKYIHESKMIRCWILRDEARKYLFIRFLSMETWWLRVLIKTIYIRCGSNIKPSIDRFEQNRRVNIQQVLSRNHAHYKYVTTSCAFDACKMSVQFYIVSVLLVISVFMGNMKRMFRTRTACY